MKIAPAAPGGLGKVAALEAQASGGWSLEQLAGELRGPGALLLTAAPKGGGLAGFLLGRTVAGEAEVLRLAVAPAWRRQGIGLALGRAFLHQAAARGACCCFLEVRSGNLAARALYARLGFTAVGRRRGYYTNPREDALVLRASLGKEEDHAQYP